MYPRNGAKVLVILLIATLPACSQRGQVELGFANIETVIAADHPGGDQHAASGIIVRNYNRTRKREVFVMSSQIGQAFVPLRPGEYCTEALNRSGKYMQMDPEQHRCFDVQPGETITVGVVIVSDSRAH